MPPVVPKKAGRIAALNTQCKEGLAKIPKVKLLTPKDRAEPRQ